MVLLAALRQAGTVVHAPVQRLHLSIPAEAAAAVIPALTKLGGAVPTQLMTSTSRVMETEFDHYEPVRPRSPLRTR